MYRANCDLPVLLRDLSLWLMLGIFLFYFFAVLTVSLHSSLQWATDPKAICQGLKFCSMQKFQLEDCATEYQTHMLFTYQLLVCSEGMCWVIMLLHICSYQASFATRTSSNSSKQESREAVALLSITWRGRNKKRIKSLQAYSLQFRQVMPRTAFLLPCIP